MRTATAAPAAVLLGVLAACGHSSPVAPPATIGPCPTGTTTTTVAPAVGGVQVLSTPATLACISLAASGGSSFLVVGANANTLPDAVGGYLMTSATAPVADLVGGVSGDVAVAGASGSAIAEGRFRQLERRSLRLDDPARRLAVSRYLAESRVHAAVVAAALPAVGDTLTFNVPDATASNACTSYTTVKAVVEAVGTHGIIVQDTAAPSGGFTASDFASISTEFDNQIYDTDTLHFGGPSDIDGNGHVYLLFTPQVNKATKRGSTSILEGFFFGGDLFPPSQCAESNQAELFYLLVPDPNAVFSDARTLTDVRQSIRGTVAHEFQHMINLGVRIAENAPDEATWMNEGLSHFAEELVGRAEDGYTDTQKLAISDVADAPSYDNFNAFYGQNLARFREWLKKPGTLGATSSHADTSLAVRGAAWALLRWSADHYASTTVAAFTHALVAGPDTGVANLVARTGVPFDSLMAGWAVANYTSDAGIAGLATRYTYTSWNLRSVEAAVNQGVFPLAPLALAVNTGYSRATASAAADYFLVSLGSASSVLVGEVSVTGAPVTYTGARIYVVRLQ